MREENERIVFVSDTRKKKQEVIPFQSLLAEEFWIWCSIHKGLWNKKSKLIAPVSGFTVIASRRHQLAEANHIDVCFEVHLSQMKVNKAVKHLHPLW